MVFVQKQNGEPNGSRNALKTQKPHNTVKQTLTRKEHMMESYYLQCLALPLARVVHMSGHSVRRVVIAGVELCV